MVFTTPILENDNFAMFSHDYKDLEGNTYTFNSQGSTALNSQIETFITVKYPPSGKVILRRSLTPKMVLDKPISIKLPISE